MDQKLIRFEYIINNKVLQNKFAHTKASYQPWYKVLNIQPQGYFQYQSANPYTLW